MEGDKLHTVLYPSETAVVNQKNKKIVGCPTEDEATEYIRDADNLEKGTDVNED